MGSSRAERGTSCPSMKRRTYSRHIMTLFPWRRREMDREQARNRLIEKRKEEEDGEEGLAPKTRWWNHIWTASIQRGDLQGLRLKDSLRFGQKHASWNPEKRAIGLSRDPSLPPIEWPRFGSHRPHFLQAVLFYPALCRELCLSLWSNVLYTSAKSLQKVSGQFSQCEWVIVTGDTRIRNIENIFHFG